MEHMKDEKSTAARQGARHQQDVATEEIIATVDPHTVETMVVATEDDGSQSNEAEHDYQGGDRRETGSDGDDEEEEGEGDHSRDESGTGGEYSTMSGRPSGSNDPNASETGHHHGGSGSSRGIYKQKYKKSWENDPEFRDWLAPFPKDALAALCRICRCKLHAHKKGLLAHAKSSKHRRYSLMYPRGSGESIQTVTVNGTPLIADDRKNRKAKFNDSWIADPTFAQWLRKVPSDPSKALCIACRCVITAGKSELIKHSQAAKHKKALMDGVPDEVGEFEIDWLDPNFVQESDGSHQAMVAIQAAAFQTQTITTHHYSTVPSGDVLGMQLGQVIRELESIAPLHLAGSWDNVGLLCAPGRGDILKVNNVLLTIDLTERIIEEAVKKRCSLIVAYHPPIFKPLKSLTPKNWKEKLMVLCLENKIAVYSPHTALDAIKGGINDWLLAAFADSGEVQCAPIEQSYVDAKNPGYYSNCIDVMLECLDEGLSTTLGSLGNCVLAIKSNEYGNVDLKMFCDDQTMLKVMEILSQYPSNQMCTRITKMTKPPMPGAGMGRLAHLPSPMPLYEVVHRVKQHLGIPHVRLAISPKHTRDTKVNSIAVCAGSGASVLRGVKADLLLTGEMGHHEVLDAMHNGSSVILTEHSNTERGFLKVFADMIVEKCNLAASCSNANYNAINVLVSEIDRDPLRIV